MPITTRNLLEQYTEILKKIYGKHLKTVILYGSYARGTNTSESDVDVASFNIIYSKNSSSSASSTGRA